MSRLFWKVFFICVLAQIAFAGGLGAAVWWYRPAEAGPAPCNTKLQEPHLAAALTVLRHGGVDALRDLLVERETGAAVPIFAVDESGKEIFGREPPQALLQQARAAVEGGGQEDRLVPANDGHAYLLFMGEGASAGEAPPRLAEPASPKPVAGVPPALLAGAGGLAGLLLSAGMAWYLTRSVRGWRQAADDLAEGKLDSRVGSAIGRGHGELAGLAQHLGQMAERGGGLASAQQKVLNEVSQELRGPLARLQAAIGLARQQPEKTGEGLARAEEEAGVMDQLVGGLLTLSLAEVGMPGSAEEMIDMAALVADAIKDLTFEADVKGIRLEYDFSGVVFIPGRRGWIKRATENIIRNAIQHTPPLGTVIIDGFYDADRRTLRIRVSDQGPGVPEEHLNAIFKPFFRVPGQPGGVGLGLAIARQAIEAHGGKIGARNRGKGGLCVEWTFRAKPSK